MTLKMPRHRSTAPAAASTSIPSAAAPARTHRNGWAYVAAIAYALIIGFSFLFVKMTVAVAQPLDVLAHRFLLSVLVMAIPVALGWIRISIRLVDLKRILPLALLSPVLFFTFQIFGLLHASSAEAGIIQATVPIFTMLLAAYFLKERTRLTQKLSLLLSVSGVILIFVWQGGAGLSAQHLGGMLLLLGSALSFAGYSVLARPLTRAYSPLELTWVTMIVAAVLFNGAAIIMHIVHGNIHSYIEPLAQPNYWMSLLYLGVLSSLGTTLLSSYALSILTATQMSVFSNFATITSMVAGAVILHERLLYYHMIGAVLIIIGVLGTNWNGKRRQTISTPSKQQ
ncbi:DMT family transporter [Paenibacillus campi]|uniref:DMT family transporter n=1 Tax=Paenibacillus campi TaxID=3106031 RepID=UPI002AFF9ACB|nr:DMT family transporter [Paenibacillus sp. SGZ-1009]